MKKVNPFFSYLLLTLVLAGITLSCKKEISEELLQLSKAEQVLSTSKSYGLIESEGLEFDFTNKLDAYTDKGYHIDMIDESGQYFLRAVFIGESNSELYQILLINAQIPDTKKIRRFNNERETTMMKRDVNSECLQGCIARKTVRGKVSYPAISSCVSECKSGYPGEN